MTALGYRIACEVGACLREHRMVMGLTQSQVAIAMFGDESYRTIVNRLENGKHAPSLESCALYMSACGASLVDVGRAIDRATEAA